MIELCDREIMPTKESFDIDQGMERVREAVRPFPKAAMFELFEHGHTLLFEQLTSCLISIRTYLDRFIRSLKKLSQNSTVNCLLKSIYS